MIFSHSLPYNWIEFKITEDLISFMKFTSCWNKVWKIIRTLDNLHIFGDEKVLWPQVNWCIFNLKVSSQNERVFLIEINPEDYIALFIVTPFIFYNSLLVEKMQARKLVIHILLCVFNVCFFVKLGDKERLVITL